MKPTQSRIHLLMILLISSAVCLIGIRLHSATAASVAPTTGHSQRSIKSVRRTPISNTGIPIVLTSIASIGTRRPQWAQSSLAGEPVIRNTLLHAGKHPDLWKSVTPAQAVGAIFTGTWFNGAQRGLFAVTHTDNTVVYRTTDAGRTWSSFVLPQQQSVGATFSFINNQDGWMMSDQGSGAGTEGVNIYRTTNGGQTWQSVYRLHHPPTRGALPLFGQKSGIAFENHSTGWITGEVGSVRDYTWLYVTHDAGHSWHALSLPVARDLKSAFITTLPPIFTSKDGILPVEFSRTRTRIQFYRTNDGGAIWKAGTSTPPLSGFPAISFVNLRTIIVADGTHVYDTIDGGRRWTIIRPNIRLRPLFTIRFASVKRGWAFLDNNGVVSAYETVDGGRQWKPIQAFLAAARHNPDQR